MLTRSRLVKALSLPLTLALALLAFISPWGADAEPIQEASLTSSQPVLTIKKPNIEVSIAAFSDAAGTQPVSKGGALRNCGSAWFRFTIKNTGPVTAKNFYYKIVIRKNDFKIYDPPVAQMTLNGGESKSFFVGSASTSKFIPPSYELNASIVADIGNLVAESNETDNKASFTINGRCIERPGPDTPIDRSQVNVSKFMEALDRERSPARCTSPRPRNIGCTTMCKPCLIAVCENGQWNYERVEWLQEECMPRSGGERTGLCSIGISASCPAECRSCVRQ